ncbi:hypothetical protein ACF2JD_01695 [Aeromonas sp. A-5]|uniref:hypothetical protein n=1 Tax=Aeromonas ichthyocola TaxID=3367746 RepID=UPI0038E97B79
MTTELGNLSSANGASLQLSDKSGQVAAQLLSGLVEETWCCTAEKSGCDKN